MADTTPSVAVSTSNYDPEAGAIYTLNCTVTILPGVTVVPKIDWEGPGLGTDGVSKSEVIHVGEEDYSRWITFAPLIIAHGGEYVCTANYTLNSVTSRDGIVETVLSVISKHYS